MTARRGSPPWCVTIFYINKQAHTAAACCGLQPALSAGNSVRSVAAIEAARPLRGAHTLAGKIPSCAAHLAGRERMVTCRLAARGKAGIEKVLRSGARRRSGGAPVHGSDHARKRRERYTTRQAFDAGERVVHFARSLVARMARKPGRPAQLALRIRSAHLEVCSVATLELPVPIRHEAMARETSCQEQDRTGERRAPHASAP
jgi:hypothetical protein